MCYGRSLRNRVSAIFISCVCVKTMSFFGILAAFVLNLCYVIYAIICGRDSIFLYYTAIG